MTDPVNLGAKRVEKSGDNRDFTPKEMFEQCLADATGDEENTDAGIGIFVQRLGDGKVSDIMFRVSNLSRMEILSVCERLKFLVMD